MAEWTRREDFAALLHAAACAINDAIRDGDGDGKHEAGSWMSETIEHQLKHIEAHITAVQCGDRNEDHLAHLVFRAAIAFALRQRGSGDSDVPPFLEGKGVRGFGRGDADPLPGPPPDRGRE